jgi:uncharacterized protein YebE (UPF0316 family)
MDVEKDMALLKALKDLGYEVVDFSDHYNDGDRDVSIMLTYPELET